MVFFKTTKYQTKACNEKALQDTRTHTQRGTCCIIHPLQYALCGTFFQLDLCSMFQYRKQKTARALTKPLSTIGDRLQLPEASYLRLKQLKGRSQDLTSFYDKC